MSLLVYEYAWWWCILKGPFCLWRFFSSHFFLEFYTTTVTAVAASVSAFHTNDVYDDDDVDLDDDDDVYDGWDLLSWFMKI